MTDELSIFDQSKILGHIPRINNWLKGSTDTLVTVELDMTNLCNMRCPDCIGWAGGKTKDTLTRKQVLSYIKQLAKAKVRAVTFTGGGEPLMSPYTAEAIMYAKKLGMDVALITNGLLLTDYLNRIILDNCTWVRISLDAAFVETYKKVHGMGKDCFDIVKGNVKRLALHKEEIKSKCTVGIGYLTRKDTLDEMVNFARMGRYLGVDYIQFRPFHNDNTSIKEELEECIRRFEVKDFKVLYSNQKYIHFKDNNIRPYNKCYGANFATVIGADSKVYVCCHMRGVKKYCLGDLTKHSFKHIWNSKRKREVFDNIDFKDCTPFCRDDAFNRVLWNIKAKRQHENFL